MLLVSFGLVVYAYFLYTFMAAMMFVNNASCVHLPQVAFLFPYCIDGSLDSASLTTSSILMNSLLLGAFAIPHSTMARPAVKAVMRKVVPFLFERSVFVLQASIFLHTLIAHWHPMTTVIWSLEGAPATWVLALSVYGALQVLISTFLIDHFDLFGLRQSFMGKKYTTPGFKVWSYYKYVRHPLYLGFIINFWAAPTMTLGRLFFAFMTTTYILIAIQLEEADLTHEHGERFTSYKCMVPMLIPSLRPLKAKTA